MTSNRWENIDIICEGPTELLFIKLVLNPYFNRHSISFKPIPLFGNVSIERILDHLGRTKTRIITTFVDYYGFKVIHQRTPDMVIDQIRKEFEKKKKKNKTIIPYLQVHETDALWFSKPEILLSAMNANEDQRQQINQVIKDFPNPEDINNSFETAPSKRLESIFFGYNKITDGQKIAERVGIDNMLKKCPRFKAWVESIIHKANELRSLNTPPE